MFLKTTRALDTGKLLLAALLIKIFSLYTPDQRILVLGGHTQLSTLYNELTTQMWVSSSEIMSVKEITPDMESLQMIRESGSTVVPLNQDKAKERKAMLETNLQESIDTAKRLQGEMEDAFKHYNGDDEAEERKVVDVASDSNAALQSLTIHDGEAAFGEDSRVPSDLSEAVQDAAVLPDVESVKAACPVWGLSDDVRKEAVEHWQSAFTTERKQGDDVVEKIPGTPLSASSASPPPPSLPASPPQQKSPEEAISRLYNLGHLYNVYQSIISAREKDNDYHHTLKSKRVVMTMVSDIPDMRQVLTDAEFPEVVINLNADEQFECEVVSALGSRTKHLIMFSRMP